MHHYFLYCEFVWVFFLVFFWGGGGGTHDIFMAVICDMAMGRLADCKYCLEIVHD